MKFFSRHTVAENAEICGQKFAKLKKEKNINLAYLEAYSILTTTQRAMAQSTK